MFFFSLPPEWDMSKTDGYRLHLLGSRRTTHYVSATLWSCNADYSYTEHLPSWVLLLLGSLTAVNCNSVESQVPVNTKTKAAYVPCTFLKAILASPIRVPQFLFVSAWKSFRVKTAVKNFLKIHCWVSYRLILEKVIRELRFKIPISSLQLHCLVMQPWGESSSLSWRQRGTLGEAGLFSGMMQDFNFILQS